MFRRVRSRLLINGEVSVYFNRTCGVLQGSPFSPFRFNMFVDSLLYLLNESMVQDPVDPTSSLPTSLFYADDGTILPRSDVDVQPLLVLVKRWSMENGIDLNVSKCGFVRRVELNPPPSLGDEEVPFCETYTYLGSSVTYKGINFVEHVRKRLASAVAWTTFLRIHSETRGVAHRLRIYRRYLAPMFEYGAPLGLCLAAREFLECF